MWATGLRFRKKRKRSDTAEIRGRLHLRDVAEEELDKVTLAKLNAAVARGYDGLFADHVAEWDKKWAESDVVIEGDVKAQQGIRYNIFQLNQTYTGKDPRLNIRPKGFTGEKYGGSTYWDTEAFCFPFYLYTNEEVARNLLYYRYLHLERAKENAAKLGFKGALYPMVTMDGQECHNEWEITFEEIHRNAAIAYAIYNYTNYTGRRTPVYLRIEVLRRFELGGPRQLSPEKDVYMILGNRPMSTRITSTTTGNNTRPPGVWNTPWKSWRRWRK